METYNKFMQVFWLAIGIISLIYITYKGITDGFDRWAMYYAFSFLSFIAFFARYFMIKRMKKHQEFLNQKNKK